MLATLSHGLSRTQSLMITTPMPLDSFRVGPPESTSTTRNGSLLSRLPNPLAKRTRNAFDFSIELEDRFKTYHPNDVVKGQIILSVLKGFDITHLVVALHGFAKVFKHQQETLGQVEELVNGKGSRGFEYHGNGLASLFQDEQTLCGSGFLKKQVYKFGFELQFPAKGLPSTIEFERGTVAYMVSATVTRPTTMSPTLTKTDKISFRDSIDIESMYTPKTRVISLEPVSRRGKMKKVKTNSSVSTLDASTRHALSQNTAQHSLNGHSTTTPNQPPLSPAPSEDTIATNVTTSTGSFQVVENHSPVRRPSPQTSETRSSMTSHSSHTITATTELPRYGALAGDVVPIKVSVTHTKPHVRGVIIATLYRQGRIDMHPILPLASKGKDKDKKKEYEDVYPRSRTGLGGLYFANSSPSSVFRKDLSQSSTMMIVNPQTLTADVTTSVKVPDDAFPSIINVPGGMISFTYHVEVLIDLTGKLGESRFLPSLTSNGPTFSSGAGNVNQISSNWAHSILDTTSLRRTKSVVTFELPLVIGTKDSRRVRPNNSANRRDVPPVNGAGPAPDQQWDGEEYWPDGYEEGYTDDYCYYDEFGNPIYDEWYPQDQAHGYEHTDGPAPVLVPPPEQAEELDEKTRLRRQEELLMPSRPPDVGESSASARGFAPTAPTFDESGEPVHLPTAPTDARPPLPPTISRASARSTETIVPSYNTPPPDGSGELPLQPSADDKQELERRRLMAQASAPPAADREASSSSGATAPVMPAATAPVIDEDEEYLSRVLQNEQLGSENLPQYHR